MSISIKQHENIKKFIQGIKDLPQGEICEMEFYKDSEVIIDIQGFKKENKIMINLKIKNPEVLTNEGLLGFPEDISDFKMTEPVRKSIQNFFKVFNDCEGLSRRSNFKFKEYMFEENKVVYQSAINHE